MSDYIQIARIRGNIDLDYIQIARIRGHIDLDYIQIANIKGLQEDNKIEMIKDDFYTICMKDPKENIGLRKKCESDHLPTFKTLDISIDYLCSDFVRFCLSLYKNYSNLDRGELTIIPKKEIPISEELRRYIEEFLPDYHNIRHIVK
jgi:hypothetical protein